MPGQCGDCGMQFHHNADDLKGRPYDDDDDGDLSHPRDDDDDDGDVRSRPYDDDDDGDVRSRPHDDEDDDDDPCDGGGDDDGGHEPLGVLSVAHAGSFPRWMHLKVHVTLLAKHVSK
jgi:hypothetical protein